MDSLIVYLLAVVLLLFSHYLFFLVGKKLFSCSLDHNVLSRGVNKMKLHTDFDVDDSGRFVGVAVTDLVLSKDKYLLFVQELQSLVGKLESGGIKQ
jgi:hypothetical protein